MSLGGPSANRGKSSPGGGSLWHFFSILRYARPYFRYLYPGLACIVIVAMTYSFNIMALLPTIHLIARNQSLPARIHESVVESRLKLTLHYDDADRVLRVVDVAPNSRLAAAVRPGDRLNRLDGAVLAPDEICRRLARWEPRLSVSVGFERPGSIEDVEVETMPGPLSLLHRLVCAGASWLPQSSGPDARMATLKIVLAGIVAISMVGAAARFFGEYLIALVAARTVVSLRRKMYQRVLKLPVSHFARHGISDTISRFVQDSVDVYRGLNFVFAKSLREPLKAVFVFIVALVIDWRITLITAAAAPAAGVIIRRFGRMIRKANKRLLENYGRMIGALQDALVGIRVVKGYTMETYERLRLFNVDRQMLREQLKIERVDAVSSPAFETVGQVIAALAILYFAQQMFEGRMEFAKFATLAACVAGIFDPVRKMSSFYNRVQTANAAMDRVFEVIEGPDESARSRSRKALPPFSATIEFRDASYVYPGASTPAVDRVSLTIRRGERVAFVGPNGSGKTTLLSLLMRFFEPTGGAIFIDGRDVREYSIASLRRQMSLITQDTILFADTIANNIAYGDDRLLRMLVRRQRHPERRYNLDGQEQRIVEAARAAYADEFISEKPEGYQTLVGQQGVTLSGGQKQRIAIARAILRNAPIFIFDEATSQVDSESEQKIHDAVGRFLHGRTALIIAHRLSTILQADRIVVMDRGRIVDSGTHDQLIGRCRVYQTICGSQFVDDTVPDGAAGSAPAAPEKAASPS